MLVGNYSIGESEFLQLDPSAKGQMYFRPVTHALNLITFIFFQKNPLGYHLINLLLFYASALVFFKILVEVFYNRWLAFWSVLLFIIHPINSVCINYKNATGDPFLALAVSLALWNGLMAAQEEKAWSHEVLSLIWLVAAVFCHEIAFGFPLYLAALLYSTGRYSFKKILRICAPSTILLVIYLIMRMQFTNFKTNAFQLFSLEHFAGLGQIIYWYLTKLVSLKDIVLIWDVPPDQMDLRWAGLFFLLIAGGIWIAIRSRKRNPPVSLGLVWFLIGFIPVSLACYSRPWFGVIVQPFWLILSSLGFFIAVCGMLEKLRIKWPQLVTGGVIFVCAAVIIPAAWRYNDLWGNSIRYCQYWMSISPRNFFPRFWLAHSFVEEKRYAEAKEILDDLIVRGLRYEWTYGNLGIAEFHLGHYPQARTALFKALEFHPTRGDTHYYLGLVFLAAGDLPRAEAAFQQTIVLAPELIDARNKLAEVQALQK